MADAKWNTKGLDTILKRLKKLEQKEIAWGFFRESKYGSENDNLQVAQVAKWQEEGTRGGIGKGAIPPRPFFSTQILRIHSIGDPVGSKFSWLLQGVAKEAFLSGYRIQGFKRLGNFLQESLQEEILEWGPNPPNAKFTKEQKGHDVVLIETGKMYDSVKFKIRNDKEVEE